MKGGIHSMVPTTQKILKKKTPCFKRSETVSLKYFLLYLLLSYKETVGRDGDNNFHDPSHRIEV